MNNKFYKLESTTGEPPFIATMRLSQVLYVKITGAIIGVAFVDRSGELLFYFSTESEASRQFIELKRVLKNINP